MDSRKLASLIKSYVKDLASTDSSVTYRIPLNDELAVYVGWGGGFDKNDETAIHSKSQPEYCICVKVAENAYPYLWDDAYMPWDKVTGEVYDTDSSVSVDQNYYGLAQWLNQSYREIKKLLKKGELTF